MVLSVKLYRVVVKGKDRRYIPIDLGRRGRRSKEDVTGPFYLRYGVKYESVGQDFRTPVEAMARRQATLDAVGSGVAVRPDGDPNRKRVVDPPGGGRFSVPSVILDAAPARGTVWEVIGTGLASDARVG
jgi:hypothetical protein